jgi:hypothetical protein
MVVLLINRKHTEIQIYIYIIGMVAQSSGLYIQMYIYLKLKVCSHCALNK